MGELGMAGRLEGKVAVVTGGTAGIGLGTCKRFLQEGATVIFSARREERGRAVEAELRALARGGEVHFVQGDVGVREQIEAVADRAILGFGRIDALVNNAQGFTQSMPIMEKPDRHYQKSFDTGIFGTKWAMQRALPAMKAQGGGSIVNMTSGWAWTAPANASDYGANKAAIEALTRHAANEWGRFNINVNIVAPYSKSAMWEKYAAHSPEVAYRSSQNNPMRRIGDPVDDLGGLILGLVTEEARFITGQTFDGSGGSLYLRRNYSDTESWTEQ
jgi:NAD(P)-dependent dehydrogenase (short-subunit alcohol dehydrogenase family)